MAHPVGLDRVIEPRDGVLSLDEGRRKTAARNTECQQHHSHIDCYTVLVSRLWDCQWYMRHGLNLTHWGSVMHICVVKLTIIGSDNGLSPGRRQAIIWTNAGILLIGPLGTNFIEILIGIQTFSFKKMHLKMSSAKWRPFCLSLNVLNGLAHVMGGNFKSHWQSVCRALTQCPLRDVALILNV